VACRTVQVGVTPNFPVTGLKLVDGCGRRAVGRPVLRRTIAVMRGDVCKCGGTCADLGLKVERAEYHTGVGVWIDHREEQPLMFNF